MLRGYTRHLKNYATSTQERRLRDAGVKIIYRDDLPDAISSLRKGDMLAVTGLFVLGTNRPAIVGVLDRIHAIGAAVYDVVTGWDTNGHKAAALLSNAVAALANKERGPDRATAQEAGRKGALSDKRRARKMPMSEAEQYWHDKRLTNDEAMAQVNGHPDYSRTWSYSTLYRHLGPRGTVPGPRNSKKRVTGVVVPPKAQKRSKRGYVYFMRIDGRGPVKIGFAKSVEDRICTHSGSNHGECRVIAAMHGTMRTEHDLHQRFDALRVPRKREWFYYRGALKAFIAALPAVDETEEYRRL